MGLATYREPARPEVNETPRGKHKGCGGTWWYVQFPSYDPPKGKVGVAMYICDACAAAVSPGAFAAGSSGLVERGSA